METQTKAQPFPNQEHPGKPACFKKGFSIKSEFCTKVCKYAEDCSGGLVTITPEQKIQHQYDRGKITFKEMIGQRIELLKKSNPRKTLV